MSSTRLPDRFSGMPSRRSRRRKRRATWAGRVTRPSPKSNGEWKRPCSARKRAFTSEESKIVLTGATARTTARRADVGSAASSSGDLTRLVAQEIADPLAAVAQIAHRPRVDEIGEQDAVARVHLG